MIFLKKRHFPVIFFIFFCIGINGFSKEIFSIPENLKNNVIFWKKIYTETSLKEGLIHDSEYPLIIYKTVNIGKRTGRSRSRFIRYHKNLIAAKLKKMVRKRPSQWSVEEQKISNLFQKYASQKKLKSSWTRLRFQQGQRERYKEGLERSGAYMAFIRLIFKIYRIPGRIAYLPHVESSFNINAYSRVGAAGMWQFMRRTARLYKLKIDYRIDERRDPIKATIAAAMLLKKNYSQLKSWPLALTAYNHGLASIKRAVRLTGSRDIGVIIKKYKNRRFRFASKNFYSCFLAASEIAANPEKYFENINYHSPMQYHELPLDGYIQPKILAENLGFSQDQIKKLNPALRSSVFKQQLPLPQGYKLRIPNTISLEEAQKKLAAIPASSKNSSSNIQHYYTVRRGDTLSRISRRFRVPLTSLLLYNNINSKHRIYIGQVLRIPGKTTTRKTPRPTPPTKPAPALPSKTKISSIKTKNTTALEKSQFKILDTNFDATLYNLDVTPLQGNRYAYISATVDESLGHYAEWLDTSVNHLRRLNSWRRKINFNQKIKIPLRNHLQTLELFKSRRLEYHMAEEEDFYNQYKVVDIKKRKVKYGDTLWSLCKRDEEIPIWLLLKYNSHIDIGNLKAHTPLNIPVIVPKN